MLMSFPLFFFTLHSPLRSTLFPYTTLFRSLPRCASFRNPSVRERADFPPGGPANSGRRERLGTGRRAPVPPLPGRRSSRAATLGNQSYPCCVWLDREKECSPP